MKCPFCAHLEDKVIDSRAGGTGDVIRRRRECERCNRRFTTYERVEDVLPTVVKRDGSREPFDRQKLLRGLRIACSKRPVSIERIDAIVDAIEREAQETESREISAHDLGARAMVHLARIDEVAYVRFASVYRSFDDARAFLQEVGKLLDARSVPEPGLRIPSPVAGQTAAQGADGRAAEEVPIPPRVE